jgi:hypothetical protein
MSSFDHLTGHFFCHVDLASSQIDDSVRDNREIGDGKADRDNKNYYSLSMANVSLTTCNRSKGIVTRFSAKPRSDTAIKK